jgi:hypothetical protein
MTPFFLVQTEAQHKRYLLFRSVHKDILLYWATSTCHCAVLPASNVPARNGEKFNFTETEGGACLQAAEDCQVVGSDRSNRFANRFNCCSVTVENETQLPPSRIMIGPNNMIAANPRCEEVLAQRGHPCQREQILQRIFSRRALNAGDDLDHRVDSVRDAIRQSDSSSAWFTR